ncbi:prepilin-type N-terminal cleavage/methylation domain-containing protein [Bacillus sp. DNRA2]|uniref:prepilin-type N-terminal cleavage/methylation domain-containing protein n=1 Tax=Bacillus sp. DNRA2 TaxID=2723053 RepID=UPI00145C66C5|nr:prepilin-type N-terminal cleavage/methylation domain-containing protein [Bacillus sp. DNRA2]NMD70533.1 prepilin-type N-terminal cleavage/methylation domain-containing protein [Bacillus sp. DNRA2]
MKRNGFTLIELLAGLLLTTLFVTIATSIYITGFRQGEDTKKDVDLQQEANYIATILRKEYFSKNEYNSGTTYQLTIYTDKIELNGTTVSDKYNYNAEIQYDNETYETNEAIIVKNKAPVMINIKIIHGNDSYTLRTTLSRGV